MDDAQDIDGLAGYTEDGAVGAMKQMAIRGAELFVFRDQRAALRELLQRVDLLLQSYDEGSGVFRAVVGNIRPDFLDITFGCRGDFDVIFYAHS